MDDSLLTMNTNLSNSNKEKKKRKKSRIRCEGECSGDELEAKESDNKKDIKFHLKRIHQHTLEGGDVVEPDKLCKAKSTENVREKSTGSKDWICGDHGGGASQSKQDADRDEKPVPRDVKATKKKYDNDSYNYFMSTIYDEEPESRSFPMENIPLGLAEMNIIKIQRRREERFQFKREGRGACHNSTETPPPDQPETSIEEKVYREFTLGYHDTGVRSGPNRTMPYSRYVTPFKPPEVVKIQLRVDDDRTVAKKPFTLYRYFGWFGVALVILLIFNFSITCCSAATQHQVSKLVWLNYDNCSNVFPEDFLEKDVAEHGGILAHMFIALFIFGGVTQVADNYLVPSIEVICEDLNVESNVAGATFLAVSTSLIYLVVNSLGFHKGTDVGMQSIAGATLFKLLGTIGVCGLVAGYEVPLSFYTLGRDLLFYCVSIIMLAGFIWDLNQGRLGLIMVFYYFFYIAVVSFNKSLEGRLDTSRNNRRVKFFERTPEAVKRQHMHMIARRRTSHMLAGKTTIDRGNLRLTMAELKKMGLEEEEIFKYCKELGDVTHWSKDATAFPSNESLASKVEDVNQAIESQSQEQTPSAESQSTVNTQSTENTENTESTEKTENTEQTEEGPVEIDFSKIEEDKSEVATDNDLAQLAKRNSTMSDKPLKKPVTKVGCKSVVWILTLPFAVLHYFTIPDSRILRKKQLAVSFGTLFMATCYITTYEYIIMWMLKNISFALGIPSAVHRYIVVAIGMSVTSIYCSAVVARDGYGEMAVANAIGSNVFGILIGMGLPMTIDWGKTPHTMHGWKSHASLLAVLGSSVIILLIMFKLGSWTLNRAIALMAIWMYCVTMALQIVLECTHYDVERHLCVPSGCEGV